MYAHAFRVAIRLGALGTFDPAIDSLVQVLTRLCSVLVGLQFPSRVARTVLSELGYDVESWPWP